MISLCNGLQLERKRGGLDHNASRHFHYNPHQQLIAETDHQGKAIKAYIYAGKTRVALLDYRHNPQGELYFIHNDHLGTPKLITNSTQEIVWRNTASAFGQVQTAQINDNDHSAQTLEQNLSFPGQYRDTETGFSYNYFRDYDPSLGRYIQSDPIGLEGGVNTYGYVMGNPLGLIDPLGLVGCPSREELGKTKEVLKQVPKMFNDYLDDNALAISRGWKMLSTTAAVTAVVIATPFAVAMATIASGIDVLLAYNESSQAGNLKALGVAHSSINSSMAVKAFSSTRSGAAASLATDQMYNYFTNKDNFRDAGK